MKKSLGILFLTFLYFNGNSQTNMYEVYAIRFGGPWFMKLSKASVGTSEKATTVF